MTSQGMARDSTEEHGSINQPSPSPTSQEDDASAQEHLVQLLGCTQQTSEHPGYQPPPSFHTPHTPDVLSLIETTSPPAEEGSDKSIPLQRFREEDQGTQCPLSPRDKQKSLYIKPQRVRRLSIFRVWWLEIAACVLILLMLAAIVGTIHPYQDQPIPNWPYKLSTNTIIAFYVVVMKIALVSVISTGAPSTTCPY